MSSPVEQIKSRLNIVDFIGSYIKLQKAGINYKASCPFHSEKTPSFFVSPTRESWHCFGCNKGGDIFSFVMQMDGLDFSSALRVLADRAGVEIKHFDKKEKSERDRLINLLIDAKKFYEAELRKNNSVISYLKERGLLGETARDFGLGFAPDEWRNLYNFLKNKNYSDLETEKSGMIIKGDKGCYDRFRSRIMFPVNNSFGQVVGFSGRIFKEPTAAVEEAAKYINTPQTALYDKSKILYGFDRAKSEIKKKNCCVLVEGQMDVIMSHQAGIINTVAVSGTALTGEHLKLIRRLADNLIFAFDKDEAGEGATGRGIDLALKEGFDIKIAVVSSGKDPADSIKNNSKEWERAVDEAKNIIEFYLDLFEGLTEAEKRKKIRKTVLPYIALMQNEMDKAHWVSRIAEVLGIKEETVWDELKKADIEYFYKENKQIDEKVFNKPQTRFDLLYNRLAGFIFWQRESGGEFRKQAENIAANENIDLNNEKFADIKTHLIFEAEMFYENSNLLGQELEKMTLEFKKEKIKQDLIEITQNIKKLETGKNNEEMNEYLNKFRELAKKLGEIK